ncbi:MAG: twin-arginine translocation pathway signal protein [Pedosphaera sp.]|nr:twin-arginine translocation pathway signal protein [Pedosphaera sp.]
MVSANKKLVNPARIVCHPGKPMRSLTRWLCACFAVGLVLAGFAAEKPRPNILFILADDLGYGDLGCYGAPDIRTPNIDRLAREGVRLTDFYSNGPVCTPTRCGLMTGRYPQRIGGLEWAIPPGAKHLGLPPQEKTIATLLRESGYATAMAGKWHLGYTEDRAPNAHGFERFFGLLSGNHDYFTHRENNGERDLFLDTKPVVLEGYSTHLITQHALEFLGGMKDKPFFLYVAFNAPHFPLQGPDDGDKQVTLKNWAQGTRETYVKMVEAMDAGVGEILAALDQRGLAKNTLVVFASDNGGDRFARNLPLAHGKGTLGEGGIRVPCLARWPGKIPAGKVSHQVGITMDWSATILKLAGAQPPKDRPLDGKDLLPILAGERWGVKRTLFWRRVGPNWVETHRAVRDGNWKLIEDANGKQSLYDLAKDITEANNLAEKEKSKAARMKKLLDQWEGQIHPPLYQVSRKPEN